MVGLGTLLPCPQPGERIDWTGFEPWWVAPMAACAQDTEWHAEGDVWTHTKLVCEALVALPQWQELPVEAREIVFAAGVLHDIAKPVTTRVEDGRIRHPNHSNRGAIMTRQVLWEAGVPFEAREQVCGLIRFHQVPFFLIDDADPVRKAARVSWITRCDWLALLARADGLGRIAPDLEHIQEQITLFEEWCREHGCLDQPWPFASDHSRYLYFRTPDRDPSYAAYDDMRAEAVMMSGLPGAGKSTWARENLDLPEISLDDLRVKLKVRPGEGQGAVLDAAKEQAREYLRRGQSFVWSATNLTRELRGRLIDLFALYNARVRIVYVEAPYEKLLRQNRIREAAVPESAVEKMVRNWEVPDRTEAHQVDYVVQSA